MASMDAVSPVLQKSILEALILIYYSEPYPYITRGIVCLLGDAAHPVSD